MNRQFFSFLVAAIAISAAVVLSSCGDDDNDEGGTEGLVYLPYGSDGYSVDGGGFVTSGAVVIPPSYRGLPVVHIAQSAFLNTDITSVTIPASVKRIGNGAFSSCFSLETVTFESGSSLETIGEYAFALSSALTSITIPASVKDIRLHAFQDCSNLATVTFESGISLETISEGVFFNVALTSIIIPASVKNIGPMAFAGCSNLATVTFANGGSLEIIAHSAFIETTAVTNIAVPASVKSIHIFAFGGWTDAQTITILGHANEESAIEAWGWDWQRGCNAIIVYGQ